MRVLIQPPVATLLIMVTASLIHGVLGPWSPWLRVPFLGASLVVGGVAFMVWARIQFTRRKTTLFVGETSAQLVSEGPFRYSRNPMYVGVIAAVLGVAVWVGTWPMYLAVLVVFCFLHLVCIPREERMLRERFGEPYQAYAQEVSRWL